MAIAAGVPEEKKKYHSLVSRVATDLTSGWKSPKYIYTVFSQKLIDMQRNQKYSEYSIKSGSKWIQLLDLADNFRAAITNAFK